MTLKTFKDQNGNYVTYKLVPQSFRITTEVSSTVPGFNRTNVTKFVNVTKTREFNYEINN